MSGPIVRKYGFPNYDNIFGKRPLGTGSTNLINRANSPSSPLLTNQKRRRPPSQSRPSPRSDRLAQSRKTLCQPDFGPDHGAAAVRTSSRAATTLESDEHQRARRVE